MLLSTACTFGQRQTHLLAGALPLRWPRRGLHAEFIAKSRALCEAEQPSCQGSPQIRALLETEPSPTPPSTHQGSAHLLAASAALEVCLGGG